MKKQLLMTTIISLSATFNTIAESSGAEKAEKAEALAKEYKMTASGLKYRVIKAATGAKPKISDNVKVHYSGKLESNGKVFDSSYKRGEPATFPLNAVIQGWQEGLQIMEVGSTYEFVIPSKLAYGESGAGRMIPANATLIFEVQLLGIE